MSTADDVERLRQAAMRQPGARERASGMIKFQCPGCREDDHDVHQDNAALFIADRKWGCAYAADASDGRRHWEAIGRALGAFTHTNGYQQPVVVVESADAEAEEPEPTPAAPYTFAAAFGPDHFVSEFIAYGAQCVDS